VQRTPIIRIVKPQAAAGSADRRQFSPMTKHDLEIAVRDLTIRMGGIAILLFGALASVKFFG
jgi:hypothetical protein